MGCGDSKGEGVSQTPEKRGIMKKAPQKLQVYGDWFSSDTRAIIAILKHSKIEYDFKLVDCLK